MNSSNPQVIAYGQINQYVRDAFAGLMTLRRFGFGDKVKNKIMNGIEICKFLQEGLELSTAKVEMSFDNIPTWKAFQETTAKKATRVSENEVNAIRMKLEDILRDPKKFETDQSEVITCEDFFARLMNDMTHTTSFK